MTKIYYINLLIGKGKNFEFDVSEGKLIKPIKAGYSYEGSYKLETNNVRDELEKFCEDNANKKAQVVKRKFQKKYKKFKVDNPLYILGT